MMPRNPTNNDSNMWFSWQHGNVHFVAISTETDFPGSYVV